MNPVGSPLETFRSILVNVGHVSGMSIAYTVVLALVSKTVRFVHRRLRQLSFRSRQEEPCQ